MTLPCDHSPKPILVKYMGEVEDWRSQAEKGSILPSHGDEEETWQGLKGEERKGRSVLVPGCLGEGAECSVHSRCLGNLCRGSCWPDAVQNSDDPDVVVLRWPQTPESWG